MGTPRIERRCRRSAREAGRQVVPPGALILLRQQSGFRLVLRIGVLQQEHLGRVLARATMRRCMVAIKFGIAVGLGLASASESVTAANGRSRELRGETWS